MWLSTLMVIPDTPMVRIIRKPPSLRTLADLFEICFEAYGVDNVSLSSLQLRQHGDTFGFSISTSSHKLHLALVLRTTGISKTHARIRAVAGMLQT
jgi:hypothetical protein